MKCILTPTALASFMIVGALFAARPASAQDHQPCMSENCPAPEMPNGQGADKKFKGIDQNGQDTDQPARRPDNGHARGRTSNNALELEVGYASGYPRHDGYGL